MKLFTAVHNFVHLNLAIALFVGYFIFAIGVEPGAKNEVQICHNYPYTTVFLSNNMCVTSK